MKALAAGLGVVVLSPVLLFGTATMMATASQAAQNSGQFSDCLTTGSNTNAATKKITKLLDGADSKHVHIKDLTLPATQIPNAQTIITTGISLNVPARGQVVALATAMQESRLRNLGSGDRDSVGLFQQRPSQGWGTAQQLHDPVYATTRFYKALEKVHGWQQLTVAQAAQRVQKSGFPHAYARWESLATALDRAITASLPHSAQGKDAQDASSGASSVCVPSKDGSSWGPIPEGKVPKGYKIPKGAAPRARKAMRWAMQQLGTPYQWGGHCTSPRGPHPMGRCDCSSLTEQAYAHAGVKLTRTTYTQVRDGKAVSPQSLKPGDLIFSRGTASRPEHVGMALGDGLVIEAPRTSKPVRITPIADWSILAARRVV
ncbi:C40 family peptidase [Streptomyces sp. MCA2]|uniref:C40 family peptidase n=1 Tax=Streptomyces sp. MCA2 TaxID=2944805 RepID=UPI0020210BC5|nr:C40 family peptidase [Streptomyces sp. MCA2]MCL7493786.1 C40 family peptidase [Streptomyces sp. MCA2]